MTNETAAPGRRDRKKLATRDALRAAAWTLFSEQGVTATSIEQITDAADVSPRTFFRYFESKYDLLLPDLTALYADLEKALSQRRSSEHPLHAYEQALLTVVMQQAVSGGGLMTIVPGLDPTDPALAARLARTFLTWEERLTDVFGERLRATSPEQDADELTLQAAVTAGVAVAGTRAVLRLLRRNPGLTPTQQLHLLHVTFAFVRAGCDNAETAAGPPMASASP